MIVEIIEAIKLTETMIKTIFQSQFPRIESIRIFIKRTFTRAGTTLNAEYIKRWNNLDFAYLNAYFNIKILFFIT